MNLDSTPYALRRMPATADSVAQIRTARFIIDAHASSYGETDQIRDRHTPNGQKPLYSLTDLTERKAWASQLTGDAQTAVEAQLSVAERLGSTRRVAIAPHPDSLAILDRDFPHFSEVTDSIRRALILCRIGRAQLLRLRPTLLSGDPGVGKTAYVQALATLLATRYSKVDGGTLTSSFFLSGLDVSYASARPPGTDLGHATT